MWCSFRGYVAFQPGFRKHDDFRISSVGFVFWNSSFVPTYFVLWEKMRFRGGRHEVRDYGKVGLGGISVQILLNSTFGRRCSPNHPIHGLNLVHDFRSAIWIHLTLENRHFSKSLTKRPGLAHGSETERGHDCWHRARPIIATWCVNCFSPLHSNQLKSWNTSLSKLLETQWRQTAKSDWTANKDIPH